MAARVRPGRDGINRNYDDPTLPEWSWHIYEVIGFGDIITGFPDSPLSIEREITADPAGWNEQRPVRFFGFTLVRELGPMPELREAMGLVWRALVLWLALLALFVIAGWVS